MAHGMRLNHQIFNQPNKVSIQLEDIPVPEHYAHYASSALPKTLPAWKVFEKPPKPASAPTAESKPGSATPTPPAPDNTGLVSDGFGFEDSPDCEWISSGINSKGPEALAIGRQANFLLWGFACTPEIMTASAKDVLTNAICWIKQFDGQKPVQKKAASPRQWIFVELWVASKRNDPTPSVAESGKDVAEIDTKAAERYFGPATVQKAGGRYPALKSLFLDHLEAVHSEPRGDGGRIHTVDQDLIDLGASNRKPEFFDRALERLERDAEDPLAKRLLGRYAPQAPTAPADLKKWLASNRGRLYFSDFGGYQWFLSAASPGAAGNPAPESKPAGSRSEVGGTHLKVRTATSIARGSDTGLLRIEVEFEDGWHGYASSTVAGHPLKFFVKPGKALVTEGAPKLPSASAMHRTPAGDEHWLTGTATYEQAFRIAKDVPEGQRFFEVEVDAVVCDAMACLPPQTLEQRVGVPRD